MPPPGSGPAPGLGGVPNNTGPCGVLPCQNNHLVRVELKYKDDRSPVPAAKCTIKLGATVTNPGPLSNGVLQSTGLPGGTYTVTFPDIDGNEWAEG